MTSWSIERIEHAKRLWDDGKSASEIASEIGGGLSRNAVIGIAFRKHWSQGGARMSKPRARLARRPSVAQRESLRKVMGRPAPEGPYVPAAIPVEPPASSAVTLMWRGARQCCWPVGDATGREQLFCGGMKEIERSYCDWHARIAGAGYYTRRA